MAFYGYSEDYDNTNSIFLKFYKEGIEVRCRLYYDTMELFIIEPFKYRGDFDKCFEKFLWECDFADYIFNGDIEEIRNESINKEQVTQLHIKKRREQSRNNPISNPKTLKKFEVKGDMVVIKTSFNGGTSLICQNKDNMLCVIGINKKPSGGKIWTRLFDRYMSYCNLYGLSKNITRYDKDKIKVIEL